jgi:type I restriction enzyme R subunit
MNRLGPTEHDTCQTFVLPALLSAGWPQESIREQYPVQAETPHDFTLDEAHRKRRADYVLELSPDQPLMVVEAKRLWAEPEDGIQQAIRYATKLDVPFAVSTNGRGWVLYNAITGLQHRTETLPSPVDAWDLFTESHGLNEDARGMLLSGFNSELRNSDGSVKHLRYYQRRAIHEVIAALSSGRQRVLVVMATGTGKTMTAMQLVWKLWNFRQQQIQLDDTKRNYRVLYLADRKKLVDDPMNKAFRPVFGESVIRVRSDSTKHSRDIYFATYQALDTNVRTELDDISEADDVTEARELLHSYPSDFFDLVIVDECHRGSARENSAWRAILDHFSSAAQLGMTATPVNRGGADTYDYFGNPVFEYSLKEGIEDGFLAPYTIRRAVFNVDAEGIEIFDGDVDASGAAMKPGVLTLRDFERKVRIPDRTRAMAAHLDGIVSGTTDRAVVFCVNGSHAAHLAQELRNLRPTKTRHSPEWVSRIMIGERDKDRLLDDFTDPENDIPQIAVTTYLLSTGIDIPDLKYVVIARPVGSVSEFKQIIGRGSRLYPEKGKTEFEIIDYVGATELFRDNKFDGPPLKPTMVVVIDSEGKAHSLLPEEQESAGEPTVALEPFAVDNHPVDVDLAMAANTTQGGGGVQPTTFQLEGLEVTLTSEGFWVHDVGTGRPRLVKYIDWAREKVLESFQGPNALLAMWADPSSRANVVSFLKSRHIDPKRLTAEVGSQNGEPVDTVDQLLSLCWGTNLLTQAERARLAKSNYQHELLALPAKARQILEALLEHYGVAGIDEISNPSIVQVPPLSYIGSPQEIAQEFGGAQDWHNARRTLQTWIYTVA